MKYRNSYILSIFLACCLCSCSEKGGKAIRCVNVEISKPKLMKFQKKLRVQGNIEPKDDADICARIDGAIDVMHVREGVSVKKGDVLFQSDRIALENHVEVAKQNVNVAETKLSAALIQHEIAKTTMEKTGIDFKRAKKLVASNAISKNAYEIAELHNKQAFANVKSAEANAAHAKAIVELSRSRMKIAIKELDDSMIKSPIDGVVTSLIKELGEYAKMGDCVLRVENVKELEISILLSSNYYAMITPGKSNTAIYNLNGEKLTESIISYRSPSIDPTSRTFEIKIDLPPNNKLVSGMLCSIDLIFVEKMAYGVPSEAVIKRSGNRTIVFIPNKNQAKSIDVECGISDNSYTEVKNIGGKELFVIVKGQAFLDDGTPIKVIDKNAVEEQNVSK